MRNYKAGLALLGGILYRMRGGWPDIKRPVEQCLFCIPIAVVSLESPWYLAALAYILSVVVVLKAHGRTMSYKEPLKGEVEWHEKYTGLIFLEGKIPTYYYKLIGNSLSGLFITLPLLLTNPIYAPVGLLKGAAYAIGWTGKLPNITIYKFTLREPTEHGEFLTGVFIWSLLLI